MSPKPYLITGRRDTGGVHDRLSIETLQKSEPEQFTLFILAYLLVQERTPVVQTIFPAFQMAKNLPATYLEIAGIHGRPYQEYAGDPADPETRASYYSAKDKKDTKPSPSRFGGYCSHGVVLFPPWHRSYMLLIEQAIGEAADALAVFINHNYDNQGSKWTKAAQQMRFPYWDFAEKSVQTDGLPKVLYDNTVSVTDPSGKAVSVENPLAYYPFEGGQVPPGFDEVTGQGSDGAAETAYFGSWLRTLRHAASSPNAKASNIDELQSQLKSQVSDLRNKVASLFVFDDNDNNSAQIWDEFSNHSTQSLRQMDYYNAGSLEGLHDSIHDIVGGNGHMAYPDYAAYDPIFFLHHCNIDRLFALWEWCYPTYWMQYGYGDNVWTQTRGTFFEVYNEPVSPDSPLAPFRNMDGKYWNSSQMRFLNSTAHPKHYSYPEIAGVKVDKEAKSQEERDNARSALQKYYGLDPRKTGKKLRAAPSKLFKTPSTPIPHGHEAVDNFRNFVAVVKLPEHAFNIPYSFRLSYQKSSGGQQTTETIGSVAVFARPDYSPCKGCAVRREAANMVRGIIPIPPAVVDDIIRSTPGLNSEGVDEDTLAEGIKSALSGRLVDSRGVELAIGHVALGADEPAAGRKPVPKRTAPGDIVLLSSAAAHPKGGGPATYFDWKNHNEIFQGGWKQGDSYPE